MLQVLACRLRTILFASARPDLHLHTWSIPPPDLALPPPHHQVLHSWLSFLSISDSCSKFLDGQQARDQTITLQTNNRTNCTMLLPDLEQLTQPS